MGNFDFIDERMVADGYEFFMCSDISDDYIDEVSPILIRGESRVSDLDFTKPSLFYSGDPRLNRVFVIPAFPNIYTKPDRIEKQAYSMVIRFNKYCAANLSDGPARMVSIRESEYDDNKHVLGMVYSVTLDGVHIFNISTNGNAGADYATSAIMSDTGLNFERAMLAIKKRGNYYLMAALIASLGSGNELYERQVSMYAKVIGISNEEASIDFVWKKHIVSSYISSIINIANDLIDNRGVVTVEATAKKKVISGKNRMVSYKDVKYRVIDLKPYRLIYEKAFPGKGLVRSLMSSHSVRGHFATYTEDKPLFGRCVGTYWKKPHVRGDKSVGEVKKIYNIVT
jgi:hypothetical protein